MLQLILPFAKQILSFAGFKASCLPAKHYRAMLTAFSTMLNHDVVIIEPLVKLAKKCPGRLILDDTGNPKYGLKKWARKMKIVGTSGYAHGYKILLFLYEGPWGRIPIGFALWHKESASINTLALKGLSLLRNQFAFKPQVVLADGAFSTDKILKRLEDYGWPCAMRVRKNRKLSNEPVVKQIARGYGSVQGRLKNGTKIKVFRRKNRLYGCNRMQWDMKQMVAVYAKRWKIEETFRALKQIVGLNRCQQHSMQAQALYILVCLLLFTGLEMHSPPFVYKSAQAVISGQLDLQHILNDTLFKLF